MSSSDLVSELRQIIQGEVISAQDPSYDAQVKRVWNARLYNKKPLTFIRVLNRNDIVNTVKFCRKNKLALCVCNGGTSMFAQDDGAVVLVLEKLNKVTVDKENKIVEVEGGATQGDVDKTTVKYNLATTLGQASYVGVSGSGLLLGMGLLGKTFGYTIDNLHSVEMVTATGETITTNESQNPELFWAMKGYGFNFGVVTKLWLKLYDIPAQVMAGNLFFSWENAADTLKFMRDFLSEKNNNRLVLYGIISTEKQKGKVVIFIRYLYNGDLDTGKQYLDEFCKKAPPVTCNDVHPMAYNTLQSYVDDLHPFGNYYFGDADSQFKDATDDAIDCLIGLYNRLPNVELMSGGACYVNNCMGAYHDIPEDSTPYLFRQTSYSITNVVSTPDTNFQSKATEWLREAGIALSPYRIKLDQSKSDQVWERLRKVKRQFDPENFFKYNINIDPK